MSLINSLKTSAKRLGATPTSVKGLLELIGSRRGRSRRSRQPQGPMNLEALEQRMLLTTVAINSGDWNDANTWDNGVPDADTPAIVSHGVAVELDGDKHFAQQVVVHGDLIVPEESVSTDPTQVEEGRMKLYVNGSLVGEAAGSQLWDHSDMTGIGGVTGQTRTHRGMQRTGNRSGNFFDGQIDKVATYNRALNTFEIDSLASGTRATYDGIPQEDLGALWMFNRTGTQRTLDTAPDDRVNDHGLLLGDATAEGELNLDGSGDYVKVGRSTEINRGVFTEKTVSLWFKADKTDGLQTLYEQGGGTRGLHIYLDGDTLYAGGWNLPRRESGWRGDWITQPGIVAGEWNHVVLTLDADGGDGPVDKSLTADWVHVNGGGQFIVGSHENRYDEGTFTLNLIGTDLTADPVIPMRMVGGMMDGMIMERELTNNNGFLMAGKNGRIQFVGEDKLSFTKLTETVELPEAGQPGATSIVVANFIERNFNAKSDAIVTSAEDDGALNWEIGDKIVIASSSYNYLEEEVRTITGISDNGDDTSTITFAEPLEFRHYGEIESYGEGTNVRTIDMRAEVALLSRNVKVKGLETQDTDNEFGDREKALTQDRVDASGLSEAEKAKLPALQIANGVGGHIMIMAGADDIVVDGVQLDGMGQASQKGRYPIHWHLGADRSEDVFRNSSVTNSNNRGVTIHGTNNLTIEGVVVHDVHGHGFFFEDAVETGNKLIGNLVLGVHTVGGQDSAFHAPGLNDPFIVDTHDSVNENRSRFSNSAAYWITNPNNTFIGNIAAGAGDQRAKGDESVKWISPSKQLASGTGFWYAIPRTAIGESSRAGGGFEDYHPIYETFGQFDYNTSHTTAIGLNFDRGSDIEDANFIEGVDLNAIQSANQYKPTQLIDPDDPDSGRIVTQHFVDGFTNYKASEAAVYHRGEAKTIQYRGLRTADSYNGPWAVSETQYIDSLYVGHSRGNSPDKTVEVGGPRLYDGAARHSGAYFAGFGADAASTFQVEGSSFGPTMYHVFPRVSFENDGTYQNMAHAVSDFQRDPQAVGPNVHELGAPQEWSKAAIDVDGSLTGAAGGGVGYSIVPKVDFLVDDDDKARTPEGWDAYLTDDIYTRVRVQNNDDGVRLFPDQDEVSMVFTSQAGETISVTKAQNNGNLSWTQVAAKADDEGVVEGTFSIEFGEQGLPEGGFALNVKNQDGNWIRENRDLFQRVNNARIVIKVTGGYNYTPQGLREVTDVSQLRWQRSENVFFRSAEDGSVYINTGITDNEPLIKFVKTGDAELQTIYEGRPEASRTIDFGTVIEAEHFDNGANGLAYSDIDNVNTRGTFRSGGVDATAETVGDIQDGEWLEYTAAIEDGIYKIGVNVSAAEAGSKIHVLAGTENDAGSLHSLGTIDVPVTTDGKFTEAWLEEYVDLAFVEGEDSVIRLLFEGEGFEVDSLKFDAPTQSAFADRSPESLTISANSTTRIELEHFDTGGQGVAYFDKTAGNQVTDGSLRPNEDVDSSFTLITNNIEDGEWLEYTTNVEAGRYDITLGKAWGGPTQSVKLFIGESNSTTVFEELGEFKFNSEEGLTLSDIDLTDWEGLDRVIRIQMVGGSFGLDWIDFISVA